jgi:hypothetical protein
MEEAAMTANPKPLTRSINRGRGHSYELDGEKVQGVTTVLNNGVPKNALTNWAARVAGEYAIDNWEALAELPPSDRLEQIRTAPDRARSQAGERGSEVHRLVQRYLAGEEVTAPDDLAGHFDAGVLFEQEWRPVEVAVEFAVFARANDWGRPRAYGGRSDLLARLADGNLWLLDWKTALKGVFPDNALQLAAYRHADFYIVDGNLDEAGQFVEHPMPFADRCGIVWLRGDGSYELVPLEADDRAYAIFVAAQEVAAFTKSERDDWIFSALRPPTSEAEAA